MSMRHLYSCILTAIVAPLILTACKNSDENKSQTASDMTAKSGITRREFGTVDGKTVYLYSLTNAKGDLVKITNYGATVTSWVSPDKNGKGLVLYSDLTVWPVTWRNLLILALSSEDMVIVSRKVNLKLVPIPIRLH